MLQIILTQSFYNMNTQNIQSTQSNTTTLNTQNNKRVLNTQSSHKAENGLKAGQGKRGNAKQRAPRYKFDETWIEAIKRCIKNGHDYNDRSHAYSADDITNLIRQYLEGTNECTELYDSSFGCAWVVIKAEIDRRKARNARARERRLQHRAAAQTIHGTARASEETLRETASGATAETQAIATGQMPANVQAQTAFSVQTDATVQTNTSVQTKVPEHTVTQAKTKAHTAGHTKAHGKAKAHARAEQLCHRNNGKTVFQKIKLKASQRRNSLNARVGKSLCNRNRHRLQHA